MNKKKALKYKKQLLEERQRILDDLDHLQSDTLNRSARDSSGNLSGYSIHIADTADEDYTRSFSLGLASGKQKILAEIEKALDKIEEGKYGKCENCGGTIPMKRLNAKPSARYCLKCAQKMEAEGLI